jgi:DNA-directed RNA polymerase specialized sigma24 family protein
MVSECEGSISQFLGGLKAGDAGAAQGLWEHCSGDLIRLARAKLRATSRAAADEEDVALSAFASLCGRASRGRFPHLEDRDDLWKILVTITARKAANLVRDARRQKRGGGQVLDAADLGGAGSREDGDVFALIPGPEPGPEFEAQAAEECRRLLGLLRDDTLRRVALDRMAGYDEAEIAARLGCARRTVIRKLVVIRNTWRGEQSHENRSPDPPRRPGPGTG